MRHHLTVLPILALLFGGHALAGDPVVARQEFKESLTYPFIFKAEGYLASKGPLPMRFGNVGPGCEQRQPPPPPVISKKEPAPDAPTPDEKPPTAPAGPAESTTDTTTLEAPAKREQPDFSKVPDEVLNFFKNTEGRPVRRAYLFDPIFQPVTPDELPKSKAISVQK